MRKLTAQFACMWRKTAVTASSDSLRRYRITVHGECGALLATAIDRIEVESCRAGETRIVVSVTDDSGFWGVMDRFQDLALHVVSVYELCDKEDTAGSHEAAADTTSAKARLTPTRLSLRSPSP
jgi:hypothetical protein